MKFASGIISGVALVLAVIFYGVGRAVGRRTQRQERAILVLASISLILAALMAATVTTIAKKVNGPLIVINAVTLLLMIIVGMLGGLAHELALRRPDRRKRAPIKSGATMVGLLIMSGSLYLANVPLIQQANELGLLNGSKNYEPEKNKACPENLKSLYTALTLYAQDWDALPPAANWLDNEDLTSKVRQNEWLHCPEVSNRNDNKYGYAYNQSVAGRKLNGKPLTEMPDAAKTPLLYDSTDLNKNAHDAVTSLPRPGRHGGRNNILYCDGHVEAVAPK